MSQHVCKSRCKCTQEQVHALSCTQRHTGLARDFRQAIEKAEKGKIFAVVCCDIVLLIVDQSGQCSQITLCQQRGSSIILLPVSSRSSWNTRCSCTRTQHSIIKHHMHTHKLGAVSISVWQRTQVIYLPIQQHAFLSRCAHLQRCWHSAFTCKEYLMSHFKIL